VRCRGQQPARSIGILAALDLGGPAPERDKPLRDVADGRLIVGIRSEVPRPGELLSPVTEEPRRERQVPRQRPEHVLPGPHGIGVSQAHRPVSSERAQAVRHEAVGGPVAAADDVAGASARDACRMAAIPK
jgi:hypothetical protein